MRTAAVELGGTKSIALIGDGEQIVDRLVVPTTAPDETLGPLVDWLGERGGRSDLAAFGLASFGPLVLDPARPDYGSTAATPKPGWNGVPLLAPFLDRLDCPVRIETDVNAAAMAEYRWGAGQGCSSLVYITIGTGIGAGILVEGHPVHGRLHPEAGHLLLRRRAGDDFPGVCPFHGDCAEGLVSGPALQARFGGDTRGVAADDPRWAAVAHDLAQLFASLVFTLAPQRILIGGGAGLGLPHLLPAARAILPSIFGGYFPDLDEKALEQVIQPAGLGADAGPLGALAVALSALR